MKSIFNSFLILFSSILISCSTNTVRNNPVTFQDRLDQIRIENEIPGMALCIFSSDTVYEFTTSGYIKLGSDLKVKKNNLWHLGSNTKSFIAFAASSMVEDGLLEWDTQFFDLFPEYKEKSMPEFHDITLQHLLQHRAGLPPNTRSFPELILKYIDKDSVLQRNTLYEWAMTQDKYNGGYQYSNIAYVMIASMLEKVNKKSWKEILEERIFTPLKIKAYYGWPAMLDSNQTWGHYVDPETKDFLPHPPDDLYNLSRLGIAPAGDLCLSIPDFIKFLQDNLKGWKGEESLLDTDTYRRMHSGKEYGLGWGIVEVIHKNYFNVSVHSGSAGTFYSKALLFKKEDLGIVICMNRFVENNNEIIFPFINEVLDAGF